MNAPAKVPDFVQASSVTIPADSTLRSRVLTLSYMGYDAGTIADALSITVGQVDGHINAAVRQSENANRIAVVRERELLNLEQLELPYFEAASNGNIDALAAVLNVQKRRAALLGLDKTPPAQVNLNGPTLIQVLADMSKKEFRVEEPKLSYTVVDVTKDQEQDK